MPNFSKMPVSVTMTGEQWFALCAALAKRPLSVKGSIIALAAADMMGAQVLAAANAHVEQHFDENGDVKHGLS